VVQNGIQMRTTAVHSTGIGLQNIKDRYALLSNLPVWAGATENTFMVKVPLLRS
jgi:hypothetical protein